MKRDRSQLSSSPDMSPPPPAADGEGFDASVPMRNGTNGAVENVVISGAGPAGLMLAYVVSMGIRVFTA